MLEIHGRIRGHSKINSGTRDRDALYGPAREEIRDRGMAMAARVAVQQSHQDDGEARGCEWNVIHSHSVKSSIPLAIFNLLCTK
jgi:hypothetical protein